jgi:hypothetical protein
MMDKGYQTLANGCATSVKRTTAAMALSSP